MKSKKPTTPKKEDGQNDDLLASVLGGETEENLEGGEVSDDMPVDLAGLAGDDAEIIGPEDLLAVDAEKLEDEAPADPMSMSEFGVEAEETADPLSSEEKRYFMGEDEGDEDEEQAMIDDSFTPEDYEQ